MKNKLAFWIITVIMLVLVIYSLVCIVVFPVITDNQNPKPMVSVLKNVEQQDNKANKKKKSVDKDIKEEPIPESLVLSDPKEAVSKLFELRKTESYIESKMSLVNEDSMYLVLDLVKNVADLELKGVSLHECKVMDSHVSNLIKNQSAEVLLNWSGKPFQMLHDDATIPKVSWIIKYAPKDSIEASQAEELPEPPKRGDVYFVMDFDRNLRLIIQQADKPDKEGRKSISALKWKFRKQEIMKSLNALIRFKRETAKPTIDILLSKADATILYRALPYKPKLLLRL
jgi:hypothetical protein